MTYKRRVLSPGEIESYQLAEESLLGAILINASDDDNRDNINAIAFIVKPADFRGFNSQYPVNEWQCQNGRIYSAMLSCKGSPNIVNVATELVNRKLIKQGDVAHLSHCTAICPMSLDWNDYAVSVRYFAQLMKSLSEGGDLPKNLIITGGVDVEL